MARFPILLVMNAKAPVAVVTRRGSELAIALRFILTVVRELDVWTLAAGQRVACFAVDSHITHVQNCANLLDTTASEQTTDLHRSLGTPQGGPLCNVAGAHRVAALLERRCDYSMLVIGS